MTKAWPPGILKRLDPGSLWRAARAAAGLGPDGAARPADPTGQQVAAARRKPPAARGDHKVGAASGSTASRWVRGGSKVGAASGSTASRWVRGGRKEAATAGSAESRGVDHDGQVDGDAANRRRNLVAALVLSVLFVGVLLITVFPTRTYLSQRSATNHAERKLTALEREARQLAGRQARLRTSAEIERLAREKYLLVRPGERAYAILPPPLPPIGLPPMWPFAGVEQALSG